MVERYTPTPAEQRESNNLTFGKYIKDIGPLLLYPVGGAAIGFLGGKLKLPLFSGQNILHRGWNALMRKKNLAIDIAPNSYEYHQGNILNWGGLGLFISAFTGWKKNEQNRLDLFDVNEGLQKAIEMVPDAAAIEQDNRVLEKQIDHLREKRGEAPLFRVDEAALDGRAKEAASLEIG